ncbi:MAG: GAF domain-containing protein [Deltaproteobacteria bacterium]|nr:GAF domain-containing protein [Deltaproteobacteria bacterium]
MSSPDYLTPFAEANRAICEGADERKVLNLVTRFVTETLNIKGCFIKIKSPKGEHVERETQALDFGRSSIRVTFSQDKQLELVSSFGLSEDFIYSELSDSPESLFSRIPEDTFVIRDIRKMERTPDYKAMTAEGIGSVLLFPIEVYQENISVVALFDDKVGELTRTDVKFARAITSRAVVSFILRRSMYHLLERERQFLLSFQEISSAINSTLNIKKVLQLAVNKITGVLGARGTQIRLLDAKTQQLELAASYGLSTEFLKIGPIKEKRGADRKMIEKIIVIDDVKTDPRIEYRSEIIKENIRKILTIPLVIRKKIIGELTIFTGGDRSFGEEEIRFANAVAQQCAFAIENSRMYQRVKYEFQQLLEDFGYNGSST